MQVERTVPPHASREDRQQAGRAAFGRLRDFSGYNSVTTEAIPPFNSKTHKRIRKDPA
jgi:hypothetical protein